MNTQDKIMIASLFNTITVSDEMLKSAESIESEKVHNRYTKHKAMATVTLYDDFGIAIYGLDLAREAFDKDDSGYADFVRNLKFYTFS